MSREVPHTTTVTYHVDTNEHAKHRKKHAKSKAVHHEKPKTVHHEKHSTHKSSSSSDRKTSNKLVVRTDAQSNHAWLRVLGFGLPIVAVAALVATIIPLEMKKNANNTVSTTTSGAYSTSSGGTSGAATTSSSMLTTTTAAVDEATTEDHRNKLALIISGVIYGCVVLFALGMLGVSIRKGTRQQEGVEVRHTTRSMVIIIGIALVACAGLSALQIYSAKMMKPVNSAAIAGSFFALACGMMMVHISQGVAGSTGTKRMILTGIITLVVLMALMITLVEVKGKNTAVIGTSILAAGALVFGIISFFAIRAQEGGLMASITQFTAGHREESLVYVIFGITALVQAFMVGDAMSTASESDQKTVRLVLYTMMGVMLALVLAYKSYLARGGHTPLGFFAFAGSSVLDAARHFGTRVKSLRKKRGAVTDQGEEEGDSVDGFQAISLQGNEEEPLTLGGDSRRVYPSDTASQTSFRRKPNIEEEDE